MPTNHKRTTITLTPEIEERLDAAKKELFYNRTQSDMIRTLVIAGLNSLEVNSDIVGQKKKA